MTSLVFVAVTWAALLLSLWPLSILSAPWRARRHNAGVPAAIESPTNRPITIVVFCDRDSDGLIEVVAALKRQNYPAPKHIILAVDPTSRALSDTVKQVQHFNPEVYVTTVPEDTRNVSRRKLAIYLGVKASKTDEIVFVNSQTRILSNEWLLSVASCFTHGADIVVSPVKPDRVPGVKPLKWLRTTDFVLASLTWLSAALRGKCYRGASSNLAYRKSVFFANNGFASSLNLHYGDDDIFISEIAKNGKTAVNLNPDGVVAVKCASGFEWEERMRRRRFTMRGLGVGPRMLTSTLTWLSWINLSCGILGIIFAGSGLLMLLLSAFAIATFIAVVTLGLKSSCKFLEMSCPWFFLYPSVLLRPLLTLRRILKMRSEKEKNYTWQRLK